MSLFSKYEDNKRKTLNGEKKFIAFKGKKYALNFENMKKVCLSASEDNCGKELEITNVYESNGDDYTISSRVERETKVNKNPQNDMILYDIVKLFIISLLENDRTETEFENDFGTVFAINTLLNWGVLEEMI